MITFLELHYFANRLISEPASPEVDIRRAISAVYYGLFHRLSAAGAKAFADRGSDLESQAARAYNHATMRKVCETYARRKRYQTTG